MRLRNGSTRFFIMLGVLLFCFIAFIFTLLGLQVGQGEYYQNLSEKRISTTETIAAARGIVYDRNGEVLITNRNAYNITLSKALFDQGNKDQTILSLAALLKKYDTLPNDTLPITRQAPFTFDKSTESQTKIIDKLLSTYELPTSATPTDLINKMAEEYELTEGYSLIEKRTIVGVRYEMELREFAMSNPFVFAEDVSMDAVIAVSERSIEYPSVSVEVAAVREYVDPTVAPHILGRIGKIWAEEYETLKTQGYKMDDLVGKEGIEKVMESYLKGTDGIRLIERNSDGEVLGVTTVQQPLQGAGVVLTLDKNLQIATQNALRDVITDLRRYKDTRDADVGSAVVIQVDTGEVLAAASYPTFNIANYTSDYTALSTDPDQPLFNRAFNGTYAPGSTFKMATAIAVLEEGIVNPNSKITDKGIYTKYPGYSPRCWRYTDYGATHGTINVSEALRDSCNYFFYETADKMGIDGLNKYCTQLGLGTKTGLEINEAKGILAGPASREGQWYPGDTLQASIGQSDNLFSPVQLATYLATIVNGGTRYQTHLVKSVQDSATGRDILINQPNALSELNIKDENMKAVMKGMYLTAAEGTAANVFANYPIAIGCKTGTASVPKGTANGIFVAFAPFDDPEIAVCVVVEHGAHGNSIAPIARKIFDEYFAVNEYAGEQIGSLYLDP